MGPIAENRSRVLNALSTPTYRELKPLIQITRQLSANDSLRIARAAILRSRQNGGDYAISSAPTSPNPNITGNKHPGKTKINWLKGLSKCNQFVGDILTDAGFAMPMNKMTDGSFHYASAETLATHVQYFDQVAIDQLRVGDLVVLDWQKDGENGAHVQIITKLDTDRNILELTGAGSAGAKTQNYSVLFKSGQINRKWLELNSAALYLLRPTKKL